ncbi:MAG: two-component regulator propeller domain-containing protein [Prevotella sp.]
MKPKNKIQVILTLVLVMMALGAHAATIRQLTLADGLAGLSVTDIEEDRSGQVWIATSNGISLFNGDRIRNYSLPKTQDQQPNNCYDIELDAEGNVWAATKAGLFFLNRYSDGFVRRAEELDAVECVKCVGNKVYLGTRQGFFVMGDNGVTKVELPGGVKANNSVRNIISDSNGNIWFTTRNDVFSLATATGKLRRLPLVTPSGLSKIAVNGKYAYVGTKNNGLFRMELATGKSVPLSETPRIITSVSLYRDSILLVGSDGGGAYEVNLHTHKVMAHYGTEEPNGQRVPSNAVYSFRRFDNGCRWFGMYREGVAYTYFIFPVFQTYTCGDFDSHNIQVTAHVCHNGTRLICQCDGFYHIDEKTKKAEFHSLKSFGMNLVKNVIWYGGYFYIGSYDAGVVRYNPLNDVIERVPNCDKLSFTTISGLTITPSGSLWLTTSEGVFVINERGETRNISQRNSRLPMGIKNTFFDANGNGWIGSNYGLCLYITAEDIIKDSDFPKGFFNKIPDLKIRGNTEEIVAFDRLRIFHTDVAMKDFGELVPPSGILSENCIDALPMGNRQYWITTEKGLFLWNDATKTLAKYGASTGVDGTVNSLTLRLDDEGILWVGTSNGLKMLDTKSKAYLKKYSTQTVLIGGMVRGNSLVGSGQMMKINDRRRIDIGWNFMSQMVIISIAIPNYSDNTGKLYEYRIDGAEQWTIVNNPSSLHIDHLMPGTHTLEIRVSGFETTTSTYEINVYPTWLFYLEVGVIILGIVLFVLWRKWRRHTKVLLSEHHETEQALIDEMLKTQDTEQDKETEPDKRKYEKTRIDENEMKRLFLRMDNYVREKKPYLDKDLKMSDIASVMGVSASQLSQVFSLHIKEPYYDYINAYRLEEFKRLVAEGMHKQYTVAALSEQCGFKKTSFFSTFRKVEGMTPTEWIQRN